MTLLAEKIKTSYQTKKLWIVVVLFLLILAIASYQTYQYYLLKKELAKIQPAASSWQTLEDKEHKFSLNFPGQPEKLEETIKIEQTDVNSLSYRTLLDNGTIYSLRFVSYPEKVDLSDFDKNAKRLLKALTNTQKNTQISTVKKQIIENNPVLDIILTNQNEGIFNYRFVLKGRDFYILSTAATEGKTAESEKFFGSLSFVI